MKAHYCTVERTTLSYEGECNWCGEREMNNTLVEALAMMDYLPEKECAIIRQLIAENQELRQLLDIALFDKAQARKN